MKDFEEKVDRIKPLHNRARKHLDFDNKNLIFLRHKGQIKDKT